MQERTNYTYTHTLTHMQRLTVKIPPVLGHTTTTTTTYHQEQEPGAYSACPPSQRLLASSQLSTSLLRHAPILFHFTLDWHPAPLLALLRLLSSRKSFPSSFPSLNLSSLHPIFLVNPSIFIYPFYLIFFISSVNNYHCLNVS